ncbi:hypothetical protein [Pseudoalteromonas sp. KAN5]|uniref:hypothetical protein n=1 Tax=Pseudoalteromonas sp. KAN5 TaxID=2916633 RepID=UPI001FCB3C0E|nr:hypothetical protein [Pseudoalteromonas sp. KAN5]BDF93652.1 hypothetical protein KAN5_04900 [Pseudoalteromonas sp. KAN5]
MDKVQKYILISTPVGMSLSLMYMFGFWGEFNVNILNYISLSDILKLGIYPISVLSVLLLVIFIPLIPLEALSSQKIEVEATEIDEKKVIKRLLYVMLGSIPFIILILLDYIDLMIWTFSLPIYLSLVVMDFPKLVQMIPSSLFRYVFISFSFLLAINLYPIGQIVAEIRKESNQQLKIDGEISKYTYIDVTDKYLFLWNKETNSVKVMKLENISSFEYSVD